jgi:Uma2 family endonuclease
MSTEIHRKLFTYDDCLRMAEVGVLSPAEKVELIRGELIVMSPPGPRHGAAVDRTAEAMRDLTKGKAILRSQGGVVLDRFAAPLPDIAVLEPRADYYAERNPGAADILLIVEVANTSLEYDLTVKRELYAIMGIAEYWVADLRNNRLLVHSDPTGDRYHTVRELHRGEMIAPSRLPSCRIPVELLLP